MIAYHPIDTFSTTWNLTVRHAVIVAVFTADVRQAACAVGDSLAIYFAIPATRLTPAEVIAYHLTDFSGVFSGLMSLGECTSALLQVVSSSVSSNANGCEKLHCLKVFVVFVLFINFLANWFLYIPLDFGLSLIFGHFVLLILFLITLKGVNNLPFFVSYLFKFDYHRKVRY